VTVNVTHGNDRHTKTFVVMVNQHMVTTVTLKRS
jgi:hypothetical protein